MMQTSRRECPIRRAELKHHLVGAWLGLLLLLAGCQGSGNQGQLTPQSEPAPAVTRQAVDNLLSLYRTALRQADIDRVEALLAPSEATGAPRLQRQAAADAVTDVEALRATLRAIFRSRTVTALTIPADTVQMAADGRTLTFLEVESTEDPATLGQQTRLFRTTWGLTQDTVAGTITVRIGTVQRQGPLVQVTTPGQVQAGALTRVVVQGTGAPFPLAGGEVSVPETGAVQALAVTGDIWHGVFTPPMQASSQPLRVQLHGAGGETLVLQHLYRLRLPGEGVVARVAGTETTRLLAVAVAPDGTVWAGGDGGATLYRLPPGASTATRVGRLLTHPRGRVEDVVVDQLARLHVLVIDLDANGVVGHGNVVHDPAHPDVFCQTANIFDAVYPFRDPHGQRSASTRVVAAGGGDIWLLGSDGGVARVQDRFRDGQCPAAGVAVRYDPVLRRDNSGLLANTVPALVAGADGALWLGTALGLTRWRDGQFTPVPFERTLTVRGDATTLETFFQAVAQAIFEARPLTTVRLGSVAFVDQFGQPLVKEDLIFSAVEDSRGQLWVGTLGGGLRRLDGRGATPQETLHLTHQDGLPSNLILALAVGPDGALWVTTDKGVSRLHEDGSNVTITTFAALDGLALPVRDVAVDAAGTAWLATDGGLFQLTGRGGVVRGVVRDDTGRPIGGADVELVGTPFRAVTDADGRFGLANLPPGAFRLQVDSRLAPGGPWAPVVQDVRVTGVEQTLAVVLRPVSETSPPPSPAPEPSPPAPEPEQSPSQPGLRELVVVSGDGQTGLVGRVLPQPLVVAVREAQGQPVADIPVTFAITAGTGTLAPANPVLTDAQGRAAVTLTLGPQPGERQVTATAPELSPVTFTAHGLAATPDRLVLVSGDGQRGTVGTALPAPLVVAVLAADGIPVADVPVTFTVTAGNGRLTAAQGPAATTLTVQTGTQGQAAATWTLGPRAGEQRVTVSTPGLPSLTFSANAVAGPPARLKALAGDGAQVTVGTSLSLVVQVSDALDNPVAGVSVQFRLIAGPGSVAPASATTGLDGQAATVLSVGRTAGTIRVEASVAGLGAVTFSVLGVPDVLNPRLIIVAGNNQRGQPGEILPEPLVVRLEDQFGNVLPGVIVTAAITAGDGEFVNALAAPAPARLSNSSACPSRGEGAPTAQARTDTRGEVRFCLRVGNTATEEEGIVGQVAALGQQKSFGITVTVPTPDLPLDLAVGRDTVYVADRFAGLLVIDVRDRDHPLIVQTLDRDLEGNPINALNVAVADNFVYLATFTPAFFYVLDASTPTSVRIVHRLALPDQESSPLHIALQGTFAYVVLRNRGAGTGALHVIDIARPAAATLVGSVALANRPGGLAVADNFAYIPTFNARTGEDRLVVVDVHNPAQPVILSEDAVPHIPTSAGIFIAGHAAYTIEGEARSYSLSVLDLSTPGAPRPRGKARIHAASLPSTAATIAVADRYAYVASFDLGVQVFDISAPDQPRFIGSVSTPSVAFNVATAFDSQQARTVIYITDQAIGLHIAQGPPANDKDSDGDGVSDFFDVFPRDPQETLDTDADGMGNNADPDDDNDGFSDQEEQQQGTDPLNAQDFPVRFPVPEARNTIIVDAAAPDHTGNGSFKAPYRSITAGLKGVELLTASGVDTGITVLVRPGTYAARTTQESFPLIIRDGNVILKGGVTSSGGGVGSSIVDASFFADVFNIRTGFITVEGFTIRHGANGIIANGSAVFRQPFTLRNNHVLQNVFNGISMGLGGCVGLRCPHLSDNTIGANGFRGIELFEVTDAVLTGNSVHDNGTEGVFLFKATADLTNNSLTDNATGIVVTRDSAATMTNNTIARNRQNGLTIWASAATINEGSITANAVDGILVAEQAEATIAVAGTPLSITANGDDGIDIEADAMAEINLDNILFAGNGDRDIEGSFNEVETAH